MNRKHVLSFLFALVFVISTSSFVFGGEVSEKIFVFHGDIHKNDSIELGDISIERGVPTDFNTVEGNYRIELSSKDEIFYSKWISISFVAYPFGKPPLNLTKVTKFWRLPYYEGADYIKLYHKNNVIGTFNLSEYVCGDDGKCPDYCENRGDVDCKDRTSTTVTRHREPQSKCGNDICEVAENQTSCPTDCRSEFPYVILWGIIAIVIAIISVVIIFESKNVSVEDHER